VKSGDRVGSGAWSVESGASGTPSSLFHSPPTVLRPPSSVLRHLSPLPPSSVFSPPSSVFPLPLPSHRPPSSVFRPPSSLSPLCPLSPAAHKPYRGATQQALERNPRGAPIPLLPTSTCHTLKAYRLRMQPIRQRVLPGAMRSGVPEF